MPKAAELIAEPDKKKLEQQLEKIEDLI